MKKKLLSLLFGTLLAVQSGAHILVKADDTNHRIPKAPRITPQAFDYESIDEIISLGPSHTLDFLKLGKPDDEFSLYEENLEKERRRRKDSFITDREQIRHRIGGNFIRVYIDPSISLNVPLVIFCTHTGKYVAYRSDTPETDDRSQIIASSEKCENITVCHIDRLLYFTKNIILDLN